MPIRFGMMSVEKLLSKKGYIMMKLFKLRPKNHDGYAYDYYEDFLIAANSIPEALELMYQKISPDKQNIPYYLRSSNIKIEQLGNVELIDNRQQIIMYSYYSGD